MANSVVIAGAGWGWCRRELNGNGKTYNKDYIFLRITIKIHIFKSYHLHAPGTSLRSFRSHFFPNVPQFHHDSHFPVTFIVGQFSWGGLSHFYGRISPISISIRLMPVFKKTNKKTIGFSVLYAINLLKFAFLVSVSFYFNLFSKV